MTGLSVRGDDFSMWLLWNSRAPLKNKTGDSVNEDNTTLLDFQFDIVLWSCL